MKHNVKFISVIALIVLAISSQSAFAGRSERSEKNEIKAQQWCTDYRSTHAGAVCHVVKMPKFCPKSFHRGKRFKEFRSRGYKTCIPGSKGKVVKKAFKNTHKWGASGVKKSVQATKKIAKGTVKTGKKTTKAAATFVKKSTVWGVKGVKKSVKAHRNVLKKPVANTRTFIKNPVRSTGGFIKEITPMPND